MALSWSLSTAQLAIEVAATAAFGGGTVPVWRHDDAANDPH